MSSKSGRPGLRRFAALRSWLDPQSRSKCLGAALVELAITFPVALSIVLGSVHLSTILREANVIVEAARHGARSATAQSGKAVVGPTWVVIGYAYERTCFAGDSGDNTRLGHRVAVTAACNYIASSDLTNAYGDGSMWKVSTQVVALANPADITGTRPFIGMSVTVTALNNRGAVDVLKLILPVKPNSTSVYPLLVTT